MRTALALAGCLLVMPALACDDHHGSCEIEGWRHVDMFGSLVIEGVTTCDTGMVTIRLYGGETFLGIANGFIDGHAFSAIANDVTAPADFSIKYSIDPGW